MPGVIQDIQNFVGWTFSQFTWISLVDIALVTAVFYALLYAIRGTQAVQLLRGLIVVTLIIILVTTSVLDNLTAFRWLVSRTLTALLVAIPVIFQPELRRALERLGRAGLILRPTSKESTTRIVSSVSRAARELSERRHGALIVIERETGLENIAETGTRMDALISSDLLVTIFHPRTPLHDGAVIVRGDRVVAATAVLPLPENPSATRSMGTRHLAALGVTAVSDAIAVVVSEETGTISVARFGRIARNLDEGRLSRLLYRWYARSERRVAGAFEPLEDELTTDVASISGDGSVEERPMEEPAAVVGTE